MARYVSRRIREEGEAFGSDSFLDVICNMVGIIVILVVVAGMRAQQAEAPDTAQPAKLAEIAAQAQSLQDDVLRLAHEIEKVQMAGALVFEERRLLAVQAEQGKQWIAAARGALDATRQQDFDLRRATNAIDQEMAKVELALASDVTSERPTVQVVSYPTPISKVVTGKEAHFQLRDGRVAEVPIERLLDRLPAEMRRQEDKLRQQYEATGTAGPIAGFRMRYTLERDGGYIRLRECEFVPVSPQEGEPTGMALAATSEFRRSVAALNPRSTTVTLWTYPDGFEAYRKLKAELYQQGFAVAGRPLPFDQPIGGSPHGSRSAAE
jgi:hypothetical protein